MWSPTNQARIRDTDVLLFDEISMCTGHLFDVLECMVAIIRCRSAWSRVQTISSQAPVVNESIGGSRLGNLGISNATVSFYMLKMRWEDQASGGLGDLPPWGGMQMIVVGDFFQLPPIADGRATDQMDEVDYKNIVGRNPTYAFQSRSWSKSDFRSIVLTKVHRQSESENGLLRGLLNAMRKGEKPLAPLHSAAIRALTTPLRPNSEGIVPTQIGPLKVHAWKTNLEELGKLPGQEVHFKAKDTVDLDRYYKEKLVQKYSLEKMANLPQMWMVHLPLEKSELRQLQSRKEELFEARKYTDIKAVDVHIDALKTNIADLEADLETTTKKYYELHPDNVSSWLHEAQVTGTFTPATRQKEETELYYRRLTSFAAQLQRDYKKLNIRALEQFFNQDCNAEERLTLKEKSQVMLVYNLDIPNKLANGSRGIVEGFVRLEEYLVFVKAVKERRDQSSHGDDDGKVGTHDNGVVKPAAEDVGRNSSFQDVVYDDSLRRKDTAPSHTTEERKDDDYVCSLITTLEKDKTNDLLNGLHSMPDLDRGLVLSCLLYSCRF